MESRNGRRRGWPSARSSRPCLSATMTMRRSRPRRMPGLYGCASAVTGRLRPGWNRRAYPNGFPTASSHGAHRARSRGTDARRAHATPDVDGEYQDADEHGERADDRHRHERLVPGQRKSESYHEHRQRHVMNPEMDASEPRLSGGRPGAVNDAYVTEPAPTEKVDVRMDGRQREFLRDPHCDPHRDADDEIQRGNSDETCTHAGLPRGWCVSVDNASIRASSASMRAASKVVSSVSVRRSAGCANTCASSRA